jgi:hypothetical protein
VAYHDSSDEETWVKLADGSILNYDIWASTDLGIFHAERFIPAQTIASQVLGVSNVWVDASATSRTDPPGILTSRLQGYELGPAFLEPNGNVIFFGANGNTAIYSTTTGNWTAGPAELKKDLTITPNAADTHYTVTSGGPSTFLVGTDDPGAMLPNGHILISFSPLGPLKKDGKTYSFPEASYIYEYDPTAGPTRHSPKSPRAASTPSTPTRSTWSCCPPARY